MKKLLAILMAMALVLPMALAIDTGSSLGITIETEDFEPLIWMCDSRTVTDDNMEDGRVSGGGEPLVERTLNYAFEGEQVAWKVLVMDKNGIEKISDVFVTVDNGEVNGRTIEANCDLSDAGSNLGSDFVGDNTSNILKSCNARIDEEVLTAFDSNTQAYYECVFTVESPTSMLGEYWVEANVEDLDAQTAVVAEGEYWFLNPVVAVTLGGSLDFGTVRPGTVSYSAPITVGNGAEVGSGVLMDMFITGTDFTDPVSSGAKCPTTNQLALTNLRYFAVNGAYDTYGFGDNENPADVADAEGYVPIDYGLYFSEALYGNSEVIRNSADVADVYSLGNVLSPGSEMSVTFKLALPEPCNGDFSDGSIFFWGEAV